MTAGTASFLSATEASSPRADAARSHAVSARPMKPTVLHFISSIGGGGAEAMMMNLVETMHGGPWRTVVVAVDARPWPEQSQKMRELADAFYDLKSDAYLRKDTLRELHRIIREENPDIVQTWMHHADLIGGLTARIAGARHVVWSIHCREIHRNPGDSDLKMALLRGAMSVSSWFVPQRIISCSQAAIEDHSARGYPRSKMTWIPNGISTERFRPSSEAGAAVRRELGLPQDAPVIGYAGRFHEMKQLDVFFKAAALLQTRVPSAHFVLCGGTQDQLTPEASAAFASMTDASKVHFAPFRPDTERFYPALTLFTLSSRTEAFPMTLLEAMACGAPCAATDVGDCAAIIGDRSFVAPAGDASALADAWQRIVSLDDRARTALSATLRERVVNEFSIARTARRYAALYSQILDC